MFEFLDWGHNMQFTTNELAGVNPFMGYSAGVSYVVGAILGLYMLSRVLKKKENTVLVTLCHVAAGTLAFLALLMQLMAGNASGDTMRPDTIEGLPTGLLYIGITLGIGGFIWRDRLRHKRSLRLIIAHVSVAALSGFFLFTALIGLSKL